MMKCCKKILLILMISLILSIILSPAIIGAWTNVTINNKKNRVYDIVEHSPINPRTTRKKYWSGSRRRGNWDIVDTIAKIEDNELYQIEDRGRSRIGNLYSDSNLLNSVYRKKDKDKDDHSFKLDDKDNTATDIEAFLMYMNDGANIGMSGSENLNYWHTVVQKAWLILVKGVDDSTIDYDVDEEENVQNLIDQAKEYSNYMGEIRQKLIANTGRNEQNLNNYSDDDLNKVVDSMCRIDFNGNVSVVKENSEDYILVSDLVSNLFVLQKYTHIPIPKPDGSTEKKCIRFIINTFPDDIELVCSKANGTEETMSFARGDFDIEIQDEDKHERLNKQKWQHPSTVHCDYNGNHPITQVGSGSISRKSRDGGYPIPYSGEKFNVKIKASSITNGDVSDILADDRITNIKSISLVSNLGSTDLGLLTAKYDNLTYTGDSYNEIKQSDNSEYIDVYNEGQTDEYRLEFDGPKSTWLGYNYLKTDSILAMQEQHVDTTDMYAKADDIRQIAALDSNSGDATIYSNDENVEIDGDTINLNLWDLTKNLNNQTFLLKIDDEATLTGDGVHVGRDAALDSSNNRRTWKCYLTKPQDGILTVKNGSNTSTYSVNVDSRVERFKESDSEIQYRVYNTVGAVTDREGNTEGSYNGVDYKIEKHTNTSDIDLYYIILTGFEKDQAINFERGYFRSDNLSKPVEEINKDGKNVDNQESDINEKVKLYAGSDNIEINGKVINLNLWDLNSQLNNQKFYVKVKEKTELEGTGIHVGKDAALDSLTDRRTWQCYLTSPQDGTIKVKNGSTTALYSVNVDSRVERFKESDNEIQYRVYNTVGAVTDKNGKTEGSYNGVNYKIEKHTNTSDVDLYYIIFSGFENKGSVTFERGYFITNDRKKKIESITIGDNNSQNSKVDLNLEVKGNNIEIKNDVIQLKLSEQNNKSNFSVISSSNAILKFENIENKGKTFYDYNREKCIYTLIMTGESGTITVSDGNENSKKYTVIAKCVTETADLDSSTYMTYKIYNTSANIKDQNGKTEGTKDNVSYTINNNVNPKTITFNKELLQNGQTVTFEEGYFTSGNKKINAITINKKQSASKRNTTKNNDDMGIKGTLSKSNGATLSDIDLQISEITYENGKIVVYMHPRTGDRIENITNTGNDKPYSIYVVDNKKIRIELSGTTNINVENLGVKIQSGDINTTVNYNLSLNIDSDKFNKYVSSKNKEAESTSWSNDSFKIEIANYLNSQGGYGAKLKNEPTVNEDNDGKITITIPVEGNFDEKNLKFVDNTKQGIKNNVTIKKSNSSVQLEFNRTYFNSVYSIWFEGLINGYEDRGEAGDFYISIVALLGSKEDTEYFADYGKYRFHVQNYNTDNGELEFYQPVAVEEIAGNKLVLKLHNKYNYDFKTTLHSSNVDGAAEVKNSPDSNGDKMLEVTFDLIKLVGSTSKHLYIEVVTNNPYSSSLIEMCGITLTINPEYNGTYEATDGYYAAKIENYEVLCDIGFSKGTGGKDILSYTESLNFVDNKNTGEVVFDFILNAIIPSPNPSVQVATAFDDKQVATEWGSSAPDRGIKKIDIIGNNIVQITYDATIFWGESENITIDGITGLAVGKWNEIKINAGEGLSDVRIDVSVYKFNADEWQGDISVTNIGKDTEFPEVQNEKNDNNDWLEIKKANLNDNAGYEEYIGDGSDIEQSEIMKDFELGGVPFSNLQSVEVRKKGYLVGEDGENFVKLEFEDENAISYKINYRYDSERYYNQNWFTGDGWKDAAISLKEEDNANLKNGIVYDNKAVFAVERAGQSVITVMLKQDGKIYYKLIIVYIPQLYVGSIIDASGDENVPSRDKWHSDSGNITGLSLIGDDNLVGQYEVALNVEEKEFIFYNITESVELSDYTYTEGNSQLIQNSNSEWKSTKKAWEDAVNDDTNIRINGDSAYPTERRISEIYNLDVSETQDISGFDSATNKNYEEITTGSYNGKHRLKWAFRDSGVVEDTDKGYTLGSTMFSIFLISDQTPSTQSKVKDVVYIKEIAQWKPDHGRPIISEIGARLTIPEISGQVWIDNDTVDPKNGLNGADGKYEAGFDSTDVDAIANLYRYDAKNKNYKELITSLEIDDNGRFSIPNILPPLSPNDSKDYYYGVEYVYDGQKYEPTEFLSNVTETTDVSQRASKLTNTNVGYDANTTYYSDYADRSWAVENRETREKFDKFDDGTGIVKEVDVTQIGGTNGETSVGEAWNSGKVMVESSQSQAGQNFKYVLSKGKENESGVTPATTELWNAHKMTASTNEAGLKIPLREENYHLKENYFAKKSIKRPSGIQDHYPISEYITHINFGLVERDESDLSINRDVYDARVIVNNQYMQYLYNNLQNAAGIIPKTTYKYNLGLYSSDIEYSSGIYPKDANQYIKEIKDNSELRAFVTYKISIYNEASTTLAAVNKLDELYDNSLTMITKDSDAVDGKNYIDGGDGIYYTKALDKEDQLADNSNYKTKYNTQLVANYSYYRHLAEDANVTYTHNRKGDTENQTGMIDCKDITWNETTADSFKQAYTTDLTGIYLKPGERIEVFVSYEVDRNGYERMVNEAFDRINDSQTSLKGTKFAISDISQYSTKYGRKKNVTSVYSIEGISGKIDRDSMPGDIILLGKDVLTDPNTVDDNGNLLVDKVDKAWSEDDTSMAGLFNIEVYTEQEDQRSIKGTVWEDSWFDSNNGNGVFDGEEKGVSNIDVSLIEKIVGTDGMEYEFAHSIDSTDNKNKIMVQGSLDNKIITTSGNGEYIFNEIPPGIYVVRFKYGGHEEDLKYNGQDYKNTAYQTGFNNVQNEWHDLSEWDSGINSERISDARDYEPQRLRTIAYSRTIANENATTLAKNTDNYVIDNLYMRADTAKLNLEIERQDNVNYSSDADANVETEGNINKPTVGKYVRTVIDEDGTFNHQYDISNIDFGIEKRPETKITLDKELKNITLTKNDDSSVIFRADIKGTKEDPNDSTKTIFDIDTETGVATDMMMSLVSSGASQGFHYIQIEDSYLNNLSVKLGYNIKVTNDSDVDYVGNDLANMAKMEKIYELAAHIEQSVPYTTGHGIHYGTEVNVDGKNNILGSYYYTHNIDNSTDDVVTTTVDQVVDYIDNDIGLNEVENTNTENHSWNPATVNNVTSVGDDFKGLLSADSLTEGKLQDYKDISYFGTGKSNVVLSTNKNIKHKQSGDNLTEGNEYDIYLKDITGQDLYSKDSGKISETQARYNGDETNDKYNPYLTKALIPISASLDDSSKSTASIDITMSKTVSSGGDSESLRFDNLAEILVYSNTAGRIDREAIPGNAIEIARKAINDGGFGGSSFYWAAGYSSIKNETGEVLDGDKDSREEDETLPERDADATEYVTLTEPTGLSVSMETSNKMLIVTIIATATTAVAIVTIPIVTIVYDRNRKKRKMEE